MTNEFDDIKKLTQRFMDGLTTIEEEDRLAAYYRTHDVPEEWREYKEMFAYFDAGMPQGGDEVAARPVRRVRRLWLGVAAAAAVAVLMVMVWPRGEELAPSVQPPTAMSDAKTQPDSAASAEADTVNFRPERPAPKPVRRRIDRYRYKPAPPKVYLAKTENMECTVPADSIAAADKLLAEKMHEIEAVSEALLRNIETLNEVKTLELAGMDYEDNTDTGDAQTSDDTQY